VARRGNPKGGGSASEGGDPCADPDGLVRGDVAAHKVSVLLLAVARHTDPRLQVELEALGARVIPTRTVEEAVAHLPNIDSVLIDVGGAWEVGAEAPLRWGRCLRFHRQESTLFVRGNVAPPELRAALLEAGVDGLYSDRIDVGWVALWVHRCSLARKQRALAEAPLLLDATLRAVRLGERIAKLSPRQFALMRELLAAPGPLSRETLLERVWGGEFNVDVRTVDATVSRLRGRLRRALRFADLIRTVAHHGYVSQRKGDSPTPPLPTPPSAAPPTRCWVLVSDDAQWQTLRGAFAPLVEEIHRLGAEVEMVPREDLVVIGAARSAAWLRQWRAITRHHPDRCGLLIPGAPPPPYFAHAAVGGNLQLLSPEWLAEDAPGWLRWHQRRARGAAGEPSGGMNLLPSQFAARVRGATVPLPRKDFKVLEVLHRFAGQVVGREQLRQLVWDGSLSRESRSLDIRISNLRRQLRRHVREGPPSIETIPKVGYRLNL
jgi:DNA-binding response OmpR family regulator